MESGVIESREQFDEKPKSRAEYAFWSEELKHSQKARRKWHKQADVIVKRYLDERKDTEIPIRGDLIPFRLNLFYANVSTLQSMLYGNVPTVDVSRRYADPTDDTSRVAAEMLERLLNNDIAENPESYNSVLRSCLQDRLLPGLGCARVRYEVETESVSLAVVGSEDEEEATVERVVWEDAPIDYFFWRDVLWGWAATGPICAGLPIAPI